MAKNKQNLMIKGISQKAIWKKKKTPAIYIIKNSFMYEKLHKLRKRSTTQ